ncbi:BI4 (mitochondrion) [Scenedesmus sp. PABB004]|nr:BI4 [Scenedesmus sp. PABB004]
MQWAVSWNMLFLFERKDFFSTMHISDFWSPSIVIMKERSINQQVTNVAFFLTLCMKDKELQLVGTPEAVCPPTALKLVKKKLTKDEEDLRWAQWLAGLIDGDGCFLVSKRGSPSFEMTVHAKDEMVLRKVKQKYGGSLKARAGLNSIRWRLHHKAGILSLCTDVNGFLRHPTRLLQFEKVCALLGLQKKDVDTLTPNHGWFRGMFDADGTVTLNWKGRSRPQITISVTQKYKQIPNYYIEVFGGSLYFDKSQNGYWRWRVQSQSMVLSMIEYFKLFPVLSSRRQKLFLVPRLYTAITLGRHKPTRKLHNEWLSLVQKWNAS